MNSGVGGQVGFGHHALSEKRPLGRRIAQRHGSSALVSGPVEKPEAEAAVAAGEVPTLREIDAGAADAGFAVCHGVTPRRV